MSAYVVDRDTIHTLVAAGVQVVTLDGNRIDREYASQAGQALLDECVRSVSHRYPNDDLGELPGSYDAETIPGTEQEMTIAQWLTPYRYVAPAEPVNREQAADAISTYEYQSCEHPDWDESWSHAYCLSLRTQLPNLPAAPQPKPERPDPEAFRQLYGDLSRDETIKRIRAALKRRSGKSWSVTGGRGTGYGWIHVQSPPKRRTGAHVQREGAAFGEYEHVDTGVPQQFGLMTPQDCAELGELLGLDRPVHCQGHGIAASSDYRREYIDRAEGRIPSTHGTQYWD